MIKEALEYLVGLKPNETYGIEGRVYSDRPLHLVSEGKDYRKGVEFHSLDGIVQMIRSKIGDYTKIGEPALFIRIQDHKTVDVFTRPDEREKRVYPYEASCVDATFKEGWRGHDEAIIELKSRFIPTSDSDYLLDLISRINADQGVKTEDNGVSQTVTTKQGVSLAATEAVKPRVLLKPFRTFREIAQPESEFILRIDENMKVGLFEADGGIWKMEAKDSIKAYFEDELADLINAGTVGVIV